MTHVMEDRSHVIAVGLMLDAALCLADQIGDDPLAAHIEHARACVAERLKALG